MELVAEDREEKEEKPHHLGHRDRLRARFLKSGYEGLQEYELLELVLFSAIPRKDVKPLAKLLIDRFGGFNNVIHAPVSELIQVKGISETAAIALKAIEASAFLMMRQDVMEKPLLNSWSRMMSYLHAVMAHEKKEHFRLLFMNKKNELIADEVQQSGTVDHTPAYPREIIKRALEHGATAMILCHNHPSGDPSPSQADIDLTNAVIDAAKPFNIVIHDHVIIAASGHSSFRSLGLIS